VIRRLIHWERKELIPLDTLNDCVQKSLLHARYLLDDAIFLLKKKRISAWALSIISLEEVGKALLAYDYIQRGEDLPLDIYRRQFLSHKALNFDESATI